MAGAEFSFEVDLSGVTYFEGFDNIPTGPYEVELVSMAGHISKDDKDAGATAPTSVAVSVIVTKGEQKGKSQMLYLGLDKSKEGVRRQWLSFGLSLGMNPEKISKGVIKFTDKTIKDKDGKARKAYVFVQNPPADRNGQIDFKKIDRRFIAVEHYNRIKDAKFSDPTPGEGTGKPGKEAGNGSTPPGGFEVAGEKAPATPAPAAAQPGADDGF